MKPASSRLGRPVRVVLAFQVVLAFVVLLWPMTSRADAVDDAFVAGNEAAGAGRWSDAAEAYRRADALLRESSPVLDYNLGTAYARQGDLGPAALHFERALVAAPTTSEVYVASRENLDVVRRQLELDATKEGHLIDRSATSWEVLREILAQSFVGLVILIVGFAALVFLALELRRRQVHDARWGPTSVVLVGFAGLFILGAPLHYIASRYNRDAPIAVTLATTPVFKGPSTRHETVFEVHMGSRVRILERSRGWQRIQLSGRFEGWVPDDAVDPVRRRF